MGVVLFMVFQSFKWVGISQEVPPEPGQSPIRANQPPDLELTTALHGQSDVALNLDRQAQHSR
jgi:hypothetical protein